MSTHVITQIQVIPGSPERIWAFFCDPANLAIITPPYLDFQVKTADAGSHIYEGQIIEYTVKPILGIPLYWMTEITHVREGEYFIDEQRFGPYQLWHHEHYFKEGPGPCCICTKAAGWHFPFQEGKNNGLIRLTLITSNPALPNGRYIRWDASAGNPDGTLPLPRNPRRGPLGLR
jgi:ligand-binding SRPBCC domain-containing protein